MKENQIDIITHSIYSSVIRSDTPMARAVTLWSNIKVARVWSQIQLLVGNSASIDIIVEHENVEHLAAIEVAIIRYTASVPLILRVSTTHVRVIAQGLGTPPAVLH